MNTRSDALVDRVALQRPSRIQVLSVERTALAVLLAVALLLPAVAGEYWLKAIVIPTMIFGLAALGLNLVTGYAGLISLGQAAFMAVGAFTAVIAYGRYGVPLPFAILLAGLLAASIGAVVGVPSLRIKGLYLMVATLAAQVIVLWIIQRVPWLGGGSFGSINTPPVMIAGWHVSTSVDQYYLAFSIVALFTLLAWNLARSRIGRAWVAIRDHELAAEVQGISMLRYKLLAFTISAFYAGVAGALVVFCWVGAASVQEYQLDVSIEILGMIIIGGLGTVLGSYLGAAFVLLLPILLSTSLTAFGRTLGAHVMVPADILANARHIVFGVLILLFLVREPDGLARLWRRAAAWLGRARSSSVAQESGSLGPVDRTRSGSQ
jgi:branched-chain amino acid transport system permease protein